MSTIPSLLHRDELRVTAFQSLLDVAGIKTKTPNKNHASMLSLIAKTTLQRALGSSQDLQTRALKRIENNSAINHMQILLEKEQYKKINYRKLFFEHPEAHGALHLFKAYEKVYNDGKSEQVFGDAHEQAIINQIHTLAQFSLCKDMFSAGLKNDILRSVQSSDDGELSLHLQHVFDNSDTLLKLLAPNAKNLNNFSNKVLYSLGKHFPLILGEKNDFNEKRKVWDDLLVATFEKTATQHQLVLAKKMLVTKTNVMINKSLNNQMTERDLNQYRDLLKQLHHLTELPDFKEATDLRAITRSLFDESSTFVSLMRNPDQPEKTLNHINQQGQFITVKHFHQLSALHLSHIGINRLDHMYQRNQSEKSNRQLFKHLFVDEGAKKQLQDDYQNTPTSIGAFFMDNLFYNIKEQAKFNLHQSGVFSETQLKQLNPAQKAVLLKEYDVDLLAQTIEPNEAEIIDIASEKVVNDVHKRLTNHSVLNRFTP